MRVPIPPNPHRHSQALAVNWNVLNQKLFSLALCVAIATLLGLVFEAARLIREVHDLRIEVSAQGGALRYTIDTAGIRVEEKLGDIHQQTRIIQKRADDSLTDLRSTVKIASDETRSAATKQLKATTEAIKDQLESTKDAVVGAVEQADTDADKKKPAEVHVTTPAPVVIPMQTIPLPPPPAPDEPTKKKKGPFHRLLHPWKSGE